MEATSLFVDLDKMKSQLTRQSEPEAKAFPSSSSLHHTPMPGLTRTKGLDPRQVESAEAGTAFLGGPVECTDEKGMKTRLPRVGDIVAGCEIVEKIGQGGFGTAFLAREVGLANRQVVLKLTMGTSQEPERLATLQHAHVVPIHFVAMHGGYQVLVMPYYGRQTLADVLRSIETTHTLPVSGRGMLSTRIRAQDSTQGEGKKEKKDKGSSKELPALQPQPTRDLLAKLSFPESVVWVFARLAEGLTHAHQNGILHLDLKPQNILITDLGVPMILDFGQSQELNGKIPEGPLGGTLRYMAPEQLASFHDQSFRPDPRMDLYSLGVMLFELLTGRHPYPESLQIGLTLRQVHDLRKEFAPRVRSFNPAVSPALDAVVAKLLHPDRARRYATAEQVAEDLNRQQQNRPLKYAENPSLLELGLKFRRRHPMIASVLLALLMTGTAIATAGTAIRRAEEKATLEATLQAHHIHDRLDFLRIELTTPEGLRRRSQALTEATNLFQQYGVLDDPHWQSRPTYSKLCQLDRERLSLALGEVALLCSLAERNTAINQQASATDEAFHRSLQWNRIAERCYHGLPMPAAVREQRAWLGRKIGQLELGQELQNREVAPVGSIDLFMQSLIEYAEMKYPEAIATLEKLTEQEPSHAAAQYILGVQYQHFGRFADASERFQLAKVLMPKDPRPCLSRGLLLNLQNRPYDALTEYQQALKRDPAVLDAQYYRGKILTRLKKYDEALEAIQLAEKDPQLTYRALLYQAQILDKCHQTIRAQEVRKRAEKIEPQDEVDYVARGCDKLARKDYTGAYEDFVIATKLNKAYLHAWQNQANVLSEKLDQPEKALDALEQVTRITPNFAPAIIGEAVILARLGKRDQAHKLTTRALTITEDPMVSYQAACVYALTAGKSHSEDLLVAMSHFRQALRKGFHDFQLIADDHDVNSLRDRKDFQQALRSAQELNKK